MNSLLNPQVAAALPTFLILLALAVTIMGGLILAGFRVRGWITEQLAKVSATFKAALEEHERREDARLGGIEGKVDDARERLRRIEGKLGL